MSRDINDDYSLPPGTTVTTNTTIASAPYNAFTADVAAEFNSVRPLKYGGTGGSSAATARTALGGTATGVAVFTAATQAAAQTAIGAELPAGVVMPYMGSSAPTGWLKANGQAVSRVTYAALFAVLGTTYGSGDGSTTFNVPDLRGEFLRGWDDGRGVDASRTLGSAQAAAMLNHTHSGTTSSDGAHTHTADGFFPDGSAAGSFNVASGLFAISSDINSAGAHTHTLTTGNPSAGGGSETRPRNISALFIIKY